jgi:alkylated DNA repair dioxygenase AlkB
MVTTPKGGSRVVGWLFRAFFQQIDYSTVNEELGSLCGEYYNTMYGKQVKAPRKSCVAFSPEYGELKFVKEQQMLSSIKEDLEANVMNGRIWDGGAFDYALVHHYQSGNDYIGWHNDREALGKKGQDGSEVVSVTFLPPGAPPRALSFRFLHPELPYKGNAREFDVMLGHGDVLVMEKNCQSFFKHALLQEKPRVVTPKRVKRGYWHPRISITFRCKTDGGKRNPTETVRWKRDQARAKADAQAQAQETVGAVE